MSEFYDIDSTKVSLRELNWLTLSDAPVGLPLLADWLCEQRCSTIKYEVQPSFLNGLAGGLHDPD